MANKRKKRSKSKWQVVKCGSLGDPCDPLVLPLRYGELLWHVVGLSGVKGCEPTERSRKVRLLAAVWHLDGGDCHRALELMAASVR